MKFNLHVLSTSIVLGIGGLSCKDTYAEVVVKNGEILVDEYLYKILDKDLTQISFAEDSSALTDASLVNLSDFVKATKDESKVERYIVATWGDKDYPEKGSLSSGQKKLAEARAEKVKKALDVAGAKKIDTFEMTEQPNWIQKSFSTETAEIKNKGMNATSNQRLLKEIGKRLRDKGGPRTAVVIAKFKNEVTVN